MADVDVADQAGRALVADPGKALQRLHRRGAAVARDAVRRLVVVLAMVASNPGLQS